MRRGNFGGLLNARPGALEAEVLRLAREAMAEVVETLGREARRRTPSGATGELRGSVFTGIRGDGRGVRGRFMFARALDENGSRIERRLDALAREIAERVGG